MQDSPTPDLPRSNRKAALLGGVVGSIGLAASLFALTATAGASGPVLQTPNTEPVAATAAANDDDSFPDEEAWSEYDACIDAVFESQGFDIDEAFGELELLDMDEFDFGPAVSILDGDGISAAEFGEDDGSITVTKIGDDISVTSDGDVTFEEISWDDIEGLSDEIAEVDVLAGDVEVLDGNMFEELDNELSGCDDHLPEGIDFENFIDEGEVFAIDDADLGEVVELTEAS